MNAAGTYQRRANGVYYSGSISQEGNSSASSQSNTIATKVGSNPWQVTSTNQLIFSQSFNSAYSGSGTVEQSILGHLLTGTASEDGFVTDSYSFSGGGSSNSNGSTTSYGIGHGSTITEDNRSTNIEDSFIHRWTVNSRP
jgi:hypothetical protein